MSKTETEAVAKTGAVAGLCPTTVANLGDGLFPLETYLAAGGALGVGSDSHVSISPVEELRWLEYGQRLITRRRTLAAEPEGSTGARLYALACRGGAQASGRAAGEIGQGLRADLVVLDGAHPLLVGKRGDAILDSYLFAGNANLVRDVMVGGAWVVREGSHPQQEQIAAEFGRTMDRLTA